MDITTILLITVVILFFSLIVFICILNKKNEEIRSLNLEVEHKDKLNINEIQDYYRKEWDNEQKELSNKLNLEKKSYELKVSKYTGDLKNLETHLSEKEKRYNEVNQDLDLYKEGKIKEIDSAAAEYEKHQQTIITNALNEYRTYWTDAFNKDLAKISETRTEKLEELGEIDKELEEERAKRAAINEELRKEEEREKYQEVHRVNLTDDEKDDIRFLLSLEDRMHNKQILYKLVWSTYLQQAYKNTFHNILGDKDPKNVIYCIENINNGKKYIGKTSAEISKRWTEHIKTSLNIGTIKNTNIHKALYNHWDEFIFYIITETTKDKLSEMEKYYIDFYSSDKYGYNIKAGG